MEKGHLFFNFNSIQGFFDEIDPVDIVEYFIQFIISTLSISKSTLPLTSFYICG